MDSTPVILIMRRVFIPGKEEKRKQPQVKTNILLNLKVRVKKVQNLKIIIMTQT